MKSKIIIPIIIIAAIAIGVGIFKGEKNSIKEANVKNGQHDLYYCPMHPQILYNHPGRCPICGMDLVKKVLITHGQTSDLKGYTAISVSKQNQQLIGVRTAPVIKKSLVKIIRVPGEYEGEIYAQVFEDDIGLIKVGQGVIVEAPAFHQKYEGCVNSIDSMVDQTSRTVRVRIWLNRDNQKQFKTNMFVNVEIPIKLEEAINVPRQAVMDTGLRKIVFVQKDEGIFEPREIQTGVETDDGYEVKSGLKVGDRIVVSGNFLLDSESRVQAGQEQGAGT